MFSLSFPEHVFRQRLQDNKRYIFDFIRKRYVLLTPEEWVRQHILVYLSEVMQYPKGLLSVEKVITVNGLRKRYDIVVYDGRQQPWMLVECKEPQTPLSETTLHQLLGYHSSLQCPYWLLTNGHVNLCAEVCGGNVAWLDGLPAYDSRIFPSAQDTQRP